MSPSLLSASASPVLSLAKARGRKIHEEAGAQTGNMVIYRVGHEPREKYESVTGAQQGERAGDTTLDVLWQIPVAAVEQVSQVQVVVLEVVPKR